MGEGRGDYGIVFGSYDFHAHVLQGLELFFRSLYYGFHIFASYEFRVVRCGLSSGVPKTAKERRRV